MNALYFQGIYCCYFHAHYTNIEGWYDPEALTRECIIETFKYLCDETLRHVTNDPNIAFKTVNMSMQTIIQDTSRRIENLNAAPIGTITNIAYMNLRCNKRTLQHGILIQIQVINKHVVLARTHSAQNLHSIHPNGNNGNGHGPAQNNGYHANHLQHNRGYHQTMTENTNMMSPSHTQTQFRSVQQQQQRITERESQGRTQIG